MRLAFAFLANAAEVRDKLLYVLGGNFDTIYAQTVPTQFRGALAFRISLDESPTPATESPLTIVLKQPDGDEVRLPGTLTIEGGVDEEWDPGILVAAKLDGLPLPTFGMYEFRVLLGDVDLGGLKLKVQERPTPEHP